MTDTSKMLRYRSKEIVYALEISGFEYSRDNKKLRLSFVDESAPMVTVSPDWPYNDDLVGQYYVKHVREEKAYAFFHFEEFHSYFELAED